ncbi:MAG: hypothetical protein ACQEQC_01075 [Elusimicrobiota bacterium]
MKNITFRKKGDTVKTGLDWIIKEAEEPILNIEGPEKKKLFIKTAGTQKAAGLIKAEAIFGVK